ncbi:hypothetical protein [Acidovorax sp.]|uniref:hypothetical protein n=1 Tax=Acidovorax sp. TaxID=1872122 RepID=UPI002ACD51B3|nr:hypothetical protein [Acidovorax sp.]MDZ7862452.1 hypothetical protein [Acidovorax sp.]
MKKKLLAFGQQRWRDPSAAQRVQAPPQGRPVPDLVVSQAGMARLAQRLRAAAPARTA